MPSLNSANCDSNASSGFEYKACEAFCELRSDEREEGRRGVMGRDGMRVREAERERVRFPWPNEPVGRGFVGVVEAILRVVCGYGNCLAEA